MSQRRFAAIPAVAARTPDAPVDDLVIEMAFASEEPYERWWGIEVLDCAPQSVRLGRLNDGAALLYNHDWNDLRGVHEAGTVRCDPDHVLRGKVRITGATEDGRDAIALVTGRILTKTSVGYEIHKVIEQTTSKSGERIERELDGRLFSRVLERAHAERAGDLPAFRAALDREAGPLERAADAPAVYRVVDWEPIENSLVTVPADPTVGVGRSAEPQHPAQPSEPAAGVTGTAHEGERTATPIPTPEIKVMETVQNPGAVQPSAQPAAIDPQKRVAAILDLGAQFERFGGGALATEALRSGESVEAFTARLMKHLGDKTEQWKPELGLSQKEAQTYSLFRAISAQMTNDWTKAGFERECHGELLGRAQAADLTVRGGFFMPVEVRKLHAGRAMAKRMAAQRDLNVATSAQGGYLVGTDHNADEFIDMLKADSLLGRLGARFIGGLVGNFSAPKKTGAVTTYWLANESTAITESQPTLGQLLMSPKNVGGYTEITHQLLQQSAPDAEALTIDDIRSEIVLDIDRKGFNGTGAAGQPTGILNTAGIGSVTGTTLAYAGILEFQSDLAAGNALADGCAYVATPAVAALLMQRQRFASTDTPLWTGSMLSGQMAGFSAVGSTQIPAATMLFGNFADVIVGEWGMLEITTNPFANFPAGIIGVRGWATVDIGVRRAASFSAAATIT